MLIRSHCVQISETLLTRYRKWYLFLQWSSTPSLAPDCIVCCNYCRYEGWSSKRERGAKRKALLQTSSGNFAFRGGERLRGLHYFAQRAHRPSSVTKGGLREHSEQPSKVHLFDGEDSEEPENDCISMYLYLLTLKDVARESHWFSFQSTSTETSTKSKATILLSPGCRGPSSAWYDMFRHRRK